MWKKSHFRHTDGSYLEGKERETWRRGGMRGQAKASNEGGLPLALRRSGELFPMGLASKSTSPVPLGHMSSHSHSTPLLFSPLPSTFSSSLFSSLLSSSLLATFLLLLFYPPNPLSPLCFSHSLSSVPTPTHPLACWPDGQDVCLPGGRPVTVDLVILTLRSAHA